MKILVVDDEQTLVKGIKFNLENEGYSVECAYDGAAAVELARHNAELAGVDDCVRFEVADAAKFHRDSPYGQLVTNPPYGERLGTVREAEKLYTDIGHHFRSLSPWQVYIITSHPTFERFYGKRADKVRKLYNGMLPCYLYQYFKSEATLKK